MFIKVDFSSPIPIYEQIRTQIKFYLASGAIRENELIPSVRELAKMLAINPLTVSRAYRELQNEDLVHAVRGMGLAVSENATRRCREERSLVFEADLKKLLQEAIDSAMDPKEIEAVVFREMANIKKDNAQ